MFRFFYLTYLQRAPPYIFLTFLLFLSEYVLHLHYSVHTHSRGNKTASFSFSGENIYWLVCMRQLPLVHITHLRSSVTFCSVSRACRGKLPRRMHIGLYTGHRLKVICWSYDCIDLFLSYLSTLFNCIGYETSQNDCANDETERISNEAVAFCLHILG
jgi:hypothetical protein